MNVFVVCISDAEGSSIVSVHETYSGALDSWKDERNRLIKEYKRMKYWEVSHGSSHDYDSLYNSLIENLQCEDPLSINNYPHDTPYITEYKVLP